MTQGDERQEKTGGEDKRREEQQRQGGEGKSDGEGAGPAEDLQEDPAYNPQGPERGYKDS